MIIAGNSHVALFRNRLSERSSGSIIKVKWVGSLKAAHFVQNTSAARAIRSEFENHAGWKILSIGMHDIFDLCRACADNNKEKGFNQLVHLYKSIFTECNRAGKFGWLISPQQFDGPGTFGLPEKTVFQLSEEFNRTITEWCHGHEIAVINPLQQILDQHNKPKSDLVHKDGIHLNDRALTHYTQLLAEKTNEDIICEPLNKAKANRVHVKTEPESLALLVADELGLDWDRTGMPAGKQEEFENKIIEHIASRLKKNGEPGQIDRHTKYNHNGALNSADLVDIYNYATDIFGIDINFDVNLRQLDTVEKIGLFFRDQKTVTKNDFYETLTRDTADRLRSSETLSADSRIGSLDDVQYQSLKEMLHHQTGGDQSQYGVFFFWCALVEMARDNFSFAIALFQNAQSSDLGFPFRPSRINKYQEVCNQMLKIDRQDENASAELPNTVDRFNVNAACSIPVVQYAANAENLLSVWCDQIGGELDSIKNVYVVTHKDECRTYLKLFPNLKCLYMFVPVPAVFSRLSKTYRHDSRIKVYPFILSDRNGYDLLGFTKGSDGGHLYFEDIGRKIKNHSIISTETIEVNAFVRNRVDENPDLLICSIRGLARHIVLCMSPGIQKNLKAVCLEHRKIQRHLPVGKLKIVNHSTSNPYILFGSTPEGWDDQYCQALYINPGYSDTLFKRYASLQRLLTDGTWFKMKTVRNIKPPSIERQADTIVEELFQNGMHLLKNNQMNEAFNAFNNTIKINPKHHKALLQIGLLLHNRNKPQDALKYLAIAFSMAPANRTIAKAFADSMRKCGFEDKVQAIWRRYSAQYLQSSTPPKPHTHQIEPKAVDGMRSTIEKQSSIPGKDALEKNPSTYQTPVLTSRLVKFTDHDFDYNSTASKLKGINKSHRSITIILPTKNRAHGLEHTLASLPKAMQDSSYEIILYADKPSEDINNCIEKYNIQKIFYDHQVFEESDSFSWSKLMNHGFAHASGDWIMYASDDIVFYTGCFKSALSLIEKQSNEKIGGVTFLHRNTAETYNGFFKDFGYDTLNGDKPFINFGLIKADAFHKTNGFDQELNFFWADTDICMQIIDNGYTIVPSTGSLVDHNNILETEKKQQRIALFEKDTNYFFKKWHGAGLFNAQNPLDKVRFFLDESESRKIKRALECMHMDNEKTAGRRKLNVVIDGVIFQLQARNPMGISRVWQNLVPQLERLMPEYNITLLQRKGFDLPFVMKNVITIPCYRMENEVTLDEDDEMLMRTCRELEADLFISTYFTRAPGVSNLVMMHDLIPEIFDFDLSQPEWTSKQRAIETADAFICVSGTTQRDLIEFYPQTTNRPMVVAHNGLEGNIKAPSAEQVKRFRHEFGLDAPYVLLVGNRQGYKNGIAVLNSLAEIDDKDCPTVLCVGGEHNLLSEEKRLKEKLDIRYAGYMNDHDLAAAYGGALALLVPSKYEGFGLPVIEAMACGCPVIANASAAVSEIGAEAVCYVDVNSADDLHNALKMISHKSHRQAFIQKGLKRAIQFDWSDTARQIGDFAVALIEQPSILLTAIVSTYNASRYMKGCLEDLVHQTMADRLEIIVVDSASQEDEASIVRDFQRRHKNIKYIPTKNRESVYQAWNRGIKFALGKYVSNANTDDRHRQDAFEKMVHVLEQDEKIALVYADVIKTHKANETFKKCTPAGMLRWPDWDRNTLLEKGCFIGPQPVWRKAVHREYGYFDDNYAVSADFEFWLRISQTNDFYHINKPLGLYMDRPDSIEHADVSRKVREDQEILQRYRVAAKRRKRIGICSENDDRRYLSGLSQQESSKLGPGSALNLNSTNEAIPQGGNPMTSPETIIKTIEHLVDIGQDESASWTMDKLLADYPDDARIHNAVAAMAYTRGDTQKALVHYARAADLAPQNTAFLKDLGDFYYVVHQDAENAMAQYQKVLGVDPDCMDALIMAGHVCISLHRYPDARQFYERVLCLDPGNDDVRQCLEKMTASAEIPDSETTSVDDLYAAAQTKARDGDRGTAIALLEQLLQRESAHALSHNDLGVLYYENGDMQAALHHYEQAAALMPEKEVFQKNLADFYWAEMGDHQRAMKTYIEVLKLDPRDVDALLGCSQICRSLGKETDAREFVNIALQIEPWNENAQQLLDCIETPAEAVSSPGHPEDLYEQAQAKAAAGDLDGAITCLKQLLEASPDNAMAYNDLGVLHYEAGDKDRALAAYEQAVEADPAAVNYRKNLADLYLMELGRTEDAMKLYHGVLETNPEDVEALMAIGMVCASIGNMGDAQRFYDRALEIEPWNQAAKAAVEQLLQRAVPAEDDRNIKAAAS